MPDMFDSSQTIIRPAPRQNHRGRVGIGVAVEIGMQKAAAIPTPIATPIPIPTPMDTVFALSFVKESRVSLASGGAGLNNL
jgi:hypothetical protein